MARKRKGQPLNGWVILDKPEGLTSTQALGQVRRLFDAAKAGHGGTLDPIATGVLPLAFGEATKTLPYVVDRTKSYRFRLRWGEARDTDDREGTVTETSPVRPTREAILAALPRFIGAIEQVPPQYSAIKVDGARAYDLAREGEVFDLASRVVEVERFELVAMIDDDLAEFEVACGKGTYMRSLARDLAQALGTVGHVVTLRRLNVGPFTLERAISLDELKALAQTPELHQHLLPVETALDDIPALALTEAEAQRLRQGQSLALLLRHDRERLDQLPEDETGEGILVLASLAGRPVALAVVEGIDVHPLRILHC